MKALIDSGFLYALHDESDIHHENVRNTLNVLTKSATFKNADFLLPTIVLVEVAYLMSLKIGHHAMREFVQDMQHSPFDFEYLVPNDLKRIHELLEQYADAELDFVDAAIVAMAERLNVRHILTVDQRDFRIVRPRHCTHFELWP